MSFLDHLEDLRWLLVRSTLAIVIMAFATYFFLVITCLTLLYLVRYGQHLLPINFLWPISILRLTDSFCITEFPFIIQNTSMEGQVNVFIWVSSCRIYFKFSLYFMEIWKFISPALYKNEKKNAKAFIFFFFATLLYWSAVWLLYL
jgi:sec-independent protein translocase protein TatC